MAQVKFEVTYNDGTTKRALSTPKAMWDTEEKFGGITDGNRMRASFFLAWASLRDSGQEGATFEAWIGNVRNVEDLEDQAITSEDVDPTNPAPGSTGS